MNSIKCWIAIKLDKKFPNLCWNELTDWVLGYSSFWETFGPLDKFGIRGSAYRQTCRKCNGDDYAYCGKCERNGNFWEDDQEEVIIEFK